MTVKQSSSTCFCRAQHVLGIDSLSVHLSVTFWYCVKTYSHRIIQFSSPDSTETVVFSTYFHTLCPRRSPLRAAVSNETGGGYKRWKWKFLTTNSLYVGNDRRCAYRCSRRLVSGSHILAFDWYQFRWPWLTITHYLTLYSIFWGSLCKSEWRQTHTISSNKMS